MYIWPPAVLYIYSDYKKKKYMSQKVLQDKNIQKMVGIWQYF